MNKSINLSLILLGALALSVIVLIPLTASAGVCWEGMECPGGNQSGYSYSNYNSYGSGNTYTYASYGNINPAPAVYSMTPNSLPAGIKGNIVVRLTGYNFVPNSLAQFNNSYRSTTYRDSQHVDVVLNEYDLQTIGSFVITVWNPMPGGGMSNGVAFNVNSSGYSAPAVASPVVVTYAPAPKPKAPIVVQTYAPAPAPTTYIATIPNNQTNSQTNTTPATTTDPRDSYDSLTANTVFGSGSFAPSGLVQWIVFAILILLIVVLVRRVFGFNEKYQKTQMKHA